MIKCDDDYFEDINTPEQSWLLGFIAGDGSVNNDYTLRIGLSSKDIHLLERIKGFLKADNEIRRRMVFNKNTQKFYDHCFLTISRKKIYKDLIKWGITPEKSLKLERTTDSPSILIIAPSENTII